LLKFGAKPDYMGDFSALWEEKLALMLQEKVERIPGLEYNEVGGLIGRAPWFQELPGARPWSQAD